VRRALSLTMVSCLVVALIAGCGANQGSRSHEDAESEPTSSETTRSHNDADVSFAQDMIPHHRQPVEMADLAPTRAHSAEVKKLAAQIKAAQDPEIRQMTRWLHAWGEPLDEGMGTDHGGAEHGDGGHDDTEHGDTEHGETNGMPGMMSHEDMAALEQARGPEFDRMFLTMMIEHHEGAVEMARIEQRDGKNADAKKLAASIESAQTKEIRQMRELLSRS